MLLQDAMFAATSPASTQALKPIAILSFSTVRLHVSLGLPVMRFPSGAHVRATRGRQQLSMQLLSSFMIRKHTATQVLHLT